MVRVKEFAGSRMCLLCEELWMPFELPPEAKARTFVADSPQPDMPGAAPDEPREPGDETQASQAR